MNKEQHLTFALILLIASYFILHYLDLGAYLGYAVMIFVGAVLPDWIEPAKHYTHRDVFHSKTALRYCYYGLGITLVLGIFIHGFLWIFFLLIGYISHLWMDSTTKMGLPD